MRQRSLLAALLFLILPLAVWATDTQITTREEADAWLHSVTYDFLLDQVIQWSLIEHSPLTINLPPTWVVVSKDRVIEVFYNDPALAKVGYLEWSFPLKNQTFSGLIPPTPLGGYFITFGIGTAVGVGLTLLIASLVK